ncbi:NAD(P)H-binding protein [Uruburuella testudinis]|uniref:NAD(P)H-binding protein n=1 Tax=Uruburuella testudinis TaxID=1282863 RepID=A0ABY4DS49_9NEIS|nr:NAD(P)H-binding protein [Uruburuella testudinis]UOO81859.1 NAD(P)H-binding protein [Uruburuella testudinis]
MNIAVIGATGYVGNAVVKELAARGHQVTAFARNTGKVSEAANVKAVAADVNAADFAGKLAGFDAVVSAFNPGWNNPNIGADFAKGAAAITEAAKTAQVPYLLVVGGAGSLYVAPNLQLIDTPEFPQDIFDGANAARNLLTDLRDRRDVNWAFISPPAAFYEGSPSRPQGKYRSGKDEVLMNGEAPAGIHVDDLAKAIADDVEQKAHLHQRFTVAEV